MKCQNCGYPVVDGSSFCGNCGAKIEYRNKKEGILDLFKRLSSRDKFMLISIPILIAIIIIFAVFYLNRPISISVLDDNSLIIDGYDGYGNACIVSYNTSNEKMDNMIEELEIELNSMSYTSSSFEKTYQKYDMIRGLKSSVACKIDGDDFLLSNGDQVTVSCTYNEELVKKAGFKYVDTKKTYTVSELPPIKEIKLADQFTIDFEYHYGRVEPVITYTNPNSFFGTLVQFYPRYEEKENKVYVQISGYPEYIIENGYLPTDDNLYESEGGDLYMIIDQPYKLEKITSLGNTGYKDNVITALNAKVAALIKEKGDEILIHSADISYVDKNSKIQSYEFASFRDGEVVYKIKTAAMDLELKFYDEFIVLPNGKIIDIGSQNLSSKFMWYGLVENGLVY